MGREDVAIRLNPERVTEGERTSVWVLANCPVPEGGPDHSGTATSEAFIRAVTLEPVPAATPSPRSTSATPAPPARGPWVRGEARVTPTVDRGTYEVSIKCEGTNDTGTARLRVVRRPEVVPDRAPRAGGGGTAAGNMTEESGISPGTIALVGAAVLGGGAGLVAWRRRRT
ncbi:LPXTG cell wall anchor domain-containing protein [Sinosporangium siamense]|uniref:LPXTG cell wall anchor domain-containing protein n=1 Tax=Sinosporangium siamense TaxID=1367973 RepID=UPI0035F05A49